jgi:hypothetical protein
LNTVRKRLDGILRSRGIETLILTVVLDFQQMRQYFSVTRLAIFPQGKQCSQSQGVSEPIQRGYKFVNLV